MPVPRIRRGADVPDRVDTAALTISITPDGKPPFLLDLSDWPGNEAMRKEALLSIAKRTDPGINAWRRETTIRDGLRVVKAFMGWCVERNLTSFADLGLDGYLAWEQQQQERFTRSTSLSYVAIVRPFLRDLAVTQTQLRWHLESRFDYQRDSGERVVMSLPQFFAVERAAMQVVSQARFRITRAYEALTLAETVDDPTAKQKGLLTVWRGDGSDWDETLARRALGMPTPASGSSFLGNWFAPTPSEVGAAAMLLACRTGWNRSVIEHLSSGSWHLLDGQAVVGLNLDKPRRHGRRHSMDVLADYGDSSAGRAFAHIADMTAPARAWALSMGLTTDRLLLRATPGSPTVPVVGYLHEGLPRLLVLDWLPPGVGEVTFPILRRTHQALIEKAPSQNSLNVHLKTYVAASAEAKAELHAVAATGLEAMLVRAEESLAMQMHGEADLEADLNEGGKDTATAACRDFSRHPDTGQPCQESFLACLTCANAVATPRHLPRLAALHKALEDLRGNSSEQAWLAYSEHYLRLHAFLFRTVGLTDDAYQRHLQAATETDRRVVHATLIGDLDA